VTVKRTSSLFGIIAFAVVLVFLFTGCEEPSTPPDVINIAAIQGVTAPVNGGTPVSAIIENEQYSGVVAWSPNHSTFAASTVYTATITLTPKTGYTLQGVTANFFTIAGATSVSNNANSGVITAWFPASTNVINIAAIQGVIVPANGLTPVTAITESEQYSGTVTWNDNPSTFAASTVYTATITLTPKAGYTLQGVTANYFTVMGATSVGNAADSGVITASFPATDSRLVTNIVIKTQPAKLTYTHGDPLDLTGLVVTLIYNNGSTDEVNAAYFPIKSITTNPAQGNNLDNLIHNGQPVRITYGRLTYNTNNLTVNRAPVSDDFNISGTGTFTYDGIPKTVTITPKEGKSGGTITVKYNGGTTAPSAVGTYTVTFDVTAATGFYAASNLFAGTLTIEKVTPVAADFNISGIGTFPYDGNPKTVTVTPKEGKSSGTVTVKYNGGTTAPSAGAIAYTVTFDVEATTNFNAVTGLSAGILTITQAVTLNSVTVDGSVSQSSTRLTLTFSQAIAGLSAADITLTGVSNVTKGTLSGSGATYALPIYGFTAGGTLTIAVAKSAYIISGTPKTVTIYYYYYNGVSPGAIEMVQIPAGTFIMGSPASEPGRDSNETQHSVTLTRSFYMGKYQVTQAQYRAVMGAGEDRTTTTNGKGDNYPIYYVNWYDAIVFCNKLSIIEGLNPVYSIGGSTNPANWGTIPTDSNSTWDAAVMDTSKNGYRLPTEAEWEYACRGSYPNKATETNTKPFGIGDGTKMVSGMANFFVTHPYDLAQGGEYNDTGATGYLGRTTAVGSYAPNNYGLYDMHGNVFEWCWDGYSSIRVLCGGSWNIYGQILRSAYRGYLNPDNRNGILGFRLVRSN